MIGLEQHSGFTVFGFVGVVVFCFHVLLRVNVYIVPLKL